MSNRIEANPRIGESGEYSLDAVQGQSDVLVLRRSGNYVDTFSREEIEAKLNSETKVTQDEAIVAVLLGLTEPCGGCGCQDDCEQSGESEQAGSTDADSGQDAQPAAPAAPAAPAEAPQPDEATQPAEATEATEATESGEEDVASPKSDQAEGDAETGDVPQNEADL